MASVSRNVHSAVYVLYVMAYSGVSAYLSPFQYTFNINLKTWNEARSICSDGNGRLAVINTPILDEVMFELVKHLNKGILTTDLWIGLFDPNPPLGGYVWSDCQPLGTWTDWGAGEPDYHTVDHCVRYNRQGYWMTKTCDRMYHFICERPLDSCWFDTWMNSQLVGTGTDFTNVTHASCRTLCRDNGNCTALTSFQDGSCFIQTGSVPHVFTSPEMKHHHSAITEIKRCVAYVVSDFDNNYTDRSRIPNNTCVPTLAHLPASHRGTSQSLPSCREDEDEENTGQTSDVDVDELRLDRLSLSKHKRRFYSVYDNRTSAVAVGSLGIGLIAFAIAAIICMDLERLVRAIHTAVAVSPKTVKVIHAKRGII